MWKYLPTSFFCLALVLAFCLVSCHKDEDEHKKFIAKPHVVQGRAEKGPMVLGSAVELRTLDEHLVPTGASYATTLSSDAGKFDFGALKLESPYAQLTIDGYFFNEVKGELSASQITLESLVDLSDFSTINVNVLTHIKSKRIRHLMTTNGKGFKSANRQAQKELMTAFGLQKIVSQDVSQLSVTTGDDSAGALIAVSALVLAGRSEAEVVEFLARLALDFGATGTFSQESKQELAKSLDFIKDDLSRIARNVIYRYKTLGQDIMVPDLKKYFDWDNDGIAGNEDEKEVPQPEEEEDPNEGLNRTVLVYMVAENSLNSFTSSDLQEMLAGVSNIGNYNRLVIYLDDTRLPRYYVLDRKTKAVSFSSLEPTYTFPEDVNSASAQTLDQVLSYVYKNFKSRSYGIVFWSHASGWISAPNTSTPAPPKRTFGIDNGRNSASDSNAAEMEIADMARVLEKYSDIEFLMFDACFMQSIEVACQLRNTARYIIGSPAEIPGEGAPYNLLLPTLFATPFVPADAIDAYYDFYEQNRSFGVLLSVVQTAHFQQFIQTTANLLARHDLHSVDLQGALNYFDYDEWNRPTRHFPDYYDMLAIMQRTLTPDELQQWLSSLHRLIPYAPSASCWMTAFSSEWPKVDPSQYSGISMFVPLSKYIDERFYKPYFSTDWAKFINMSAPAE